MLDVIDAHQKLLSTDDARKLAELKVEVLAKK